MLTQRIATGALLVVLVVSAIVWLPPSWAGLVLGCFWLLGVREWAAGFVRFHALGTALYLLVFAVLMAVISAVSDDPRVLDVTLGVALAWWLLALVAVLSYPHKISAPVTAASGFATLLPAWVLLTSLHAREPMGRQLVLTILVIVWAADIGAFVVGRAVGRRKLAPRVSPGKTWEGLVGGLCCAAAAGWLAGAVLGMGVLRLMALAVAAAVASVVGDLTVSMFKRNVGLKDSGHLLPGHGGVLDRIDSLTAAVAIFVFGLVLIGRNT